mmetsp:Transcript_26825/g.48340  ORF Transcript_26825/g.48340 Transcript_26825/m.48340 type:complete len:280 (-) Transcript_26825:748-1587(-)
MSGLLLSYLGNTRKLNTIPSSFSALKIEASHLFNIRCPSFTYIDEERDPITVDRQQEYEEFLRLNYIKPLPLEVLDSSQQLKLCPESRIESDDVRFTLLASRLSVSEYVPDPIPDEEPKGKAACGSVNKIVEVRDYAGYLEAKCAIRQLIQTELSDLANPAPIGRKRVYAEFNRNCSVCLEVPIKEVMHVCMVCPSFCLCKSCEELCKHPHPFFKVRKLSQLQALVSARSQPIQPPSSNHREELEYILNMGFLDRDKVNTALVKSNFNVQAAVEYLLAR